MDADTVAYLRGATAPQAKRALTVVAEAYAETVDELAWQDSALCTQTDPEAFFPEKGGSTYAAKKVCKRCPVTADCLQYAIDNDERFGIWGGLSERERRKLKRDAAKQVAA